MHFLTVQILSQELLRPLAFLISVTKAVRHKTTKNKSCCCLYNKDYLRYIICISFRITIEHNSLEHTTVALKDGGGLLHPCVTLNKLYLQRASYCRSQSQRLSKDRWMCGQNNSSLYLLFMLHRPEKPVFRLINVPTYSLMWFLLFYGTTYGCHLMLLIIRFNMHHNSYTNLHESKLQRLRKSTRS